MNFQENETAIEMVGDFLERADALTERCGGAEFMAREFWDLILHAERVRLELEARREEWEETGERPDDDLAEWS